MSPSIDAPYFDTLITSDNKIYSIRGMPLNPLIELIHGITEPKPTKFNNDYEYKFVGIPNPFDVWARQYIAKWLIEDDKFFLTELEGKIYGINLTPHSFFIRHDLKTGSTFKQLATWYTGILTAYSNEKIQIIEQMKFVVFQRMIYQIEKGVVLSSEHKIFKEKYVELPF